MSQAYEHLKSMLWAGPEVNVYAFIRGDAVPDLRLRLAQGRVRDWDCLCRGALSSHEQAQAPYVAQLERVSALTDWLLIEAEQGCADWGLLGVSKQPMLEARELGRSLMQVSLPKGDVRDWTWADPQLWFPLLGQLDEAQLPVAFGCMSDWVQISPKQWTWHTLCAGQLSVASQACPVEIA